MAVPGTTPDYWMTADDRLTATMLAVLEHRAEQAAKAKRKAGGRRGQ